MEFIRILSSHPNHFIAYYPLPAAQCIPREPYTTGLVPTNLRARLKPKKAQQIYAFSDYVKDFLHANGVSGTDIGIVDVGAGQAYLTRTLAEQLQCPHLLALDSDTDQTKGATRQACAAITHVTIDITPENLISAAHDWLCSIEKPDLPLLFVGLHACGSLSVDIMRAILQTVRKTSSLVVVGGVIVPCCYNLLRPADFPLSSSQTYDLYPEVTALAQLARTEAAPLPPSAYHLATQTPSAWDPYDPSWHLGLRKVVWRAILGRILPNSFDLPEENIEEKKRKAPFPRRRIYEEQTISHPTSHEDPDGLGHSALHLCLGKLPKSAYANWEIFLRTVAHKLTISFEELVERAKSLTWKLPSDFSTEHSSSPSSIDKGVHPVILELVRSPASAEAQSFLETILDPPTHPKEHHISPPLLPARVLLTLHLTRCLVGPLVESWILLDWERWCKEELTSMRQKRTLQGSSDGDWHVSLVPLFDQSLGSGRNVALVIGAAVPTAV